MEDLKNSFKSNLQSGFLLHFSTPIKRQFSFELTMQLNRSKDKFELHGMQYNRINLNPNIQFGIRYTPYRFNK
jgi:hypothetical protein